MSDMTSKSNVAKSWICLLLVGTLNLAAAEKPAGKTAGEKKLPSETFITHPGSDFMADVPPVWATAVAAAIDITAAAIKVNLRMLNSFWFV